MVFTFKTFKVCCYSHFGKSGQVVWSSIAD